jgi:hypothetical protein
MTEIIEAANQWKEALSSGNEANVTRLYHKDAVLWGTLSPVIRNRTDLINEYFVKFATMEGIRVEFGESVIRRYGDMAVNTGYYTFSWKENGKKITVPARYTFVYILEEGWKIVDHHSSVIPEQPFDLRKYTEE